MRFIIALLAILIVPVSNAEVQPHELQLPMTCGDSTNIVKGLREKYGEEITMMSQGVNSIGDQLYHSLWINSETKTWTFVVVNKQKKTLCVMASGDNFTLFFPDNSI